MDIRLSAIFGEECQDLGVQFYTALEKWAFYSENPEVAKQLRIQLGRWLKQQKSNKNKR